MLIKVREIFATFVATVILTRGGGINDFSFSSFVVVAFLTRHRIKLQIWVVPTLFERLLVWKYCLVECLGILRTGRQALVGAGVVR